MPGLDRPGVIHEHDRKRFLYGARIVATLSDVARLAGVSSATASRVLNGVDYPVAERTRQRVIRAAEDLDFELNLVARGLASQRTGTVGVIVHDVTDSYFAEIARGIEDVAHRQGYAVLICNSDRRPDKELAYVRKLRAMRVDAVLFAAGGLRDPGGGQAIDQQLAAIASNGGVVVRLAPHPSHRADICYSNAAGFRLLVGHLAELGHREIAAVTGPPELATDGERRRAFCRAVEECGLRVRRELVVEGRFTRKSGELAVDRLLESGIGFSALCAFNDQMAIGALRRLKERGVGIPEDLSVAGFDDIQLCEYVDPPLTTVRVPLHQLGAEGMRLALRLLAGDPRPPRRRNLPVELVVRRSTGPVSTRR